MHFIDKKILNPVLQSKQIRECVNLYNKHVNNSSQSEDAY